MGINFITAKAKKFQHRRDAAFEEQLASTNLFSRLSDATIETYRCKALPDALPEAGTSVLLHRTPEAIKVFSLNKRIGTVMSPDSAALARMMGRRNTDVVAALVTDVRPLSNVFLVQLHLPAS